MKRDVNESIIIAVVLTALSYGLGVAFGWIDSVNYLEAFAVFTSYSCTYLCVKERRINYPIGAISSVAYCILFAQQDLVASSVLNGYLALSLAYGWYRWRSDDDARPVTHVSLRWVPVYLGVTAVAYVGVLLILGQLGASMALTDTMILIGTILAQFMLDNKKIENWWVWIVVDGFAIYTYFHSGLTLAGFQYIFFFLNCFYGLWAWNRSRNAKSIRTDDGIAPNLGALTPNPIQRAVS